MARSNALVPVEQKEVAFYGDEIVAVRTNDHMVLVPIRPICELLGVDWSAQRRRITRDTVLAEEMRTVAVTAMEGDRLVRRDMQSLPLDYISGFLFGINADRVKPELKERVIRYQRECYKVLAGAFQEGRLTADLSFDDLLAADSAAVQAYKMAQAIMLMARQQILLEAQVGQHASRLDAYEERLELVESTLGDPGHHVTPDQAMQISQAIKTIAGEIQKRTKRNEYGKMYGQLYREFGITSYKQLPASKFDQAMTWLTEMYRAITGATGDELPF
jgi:hypothetical protein